MLPSLLRVPCTRISVPVASALRSIVLPARKYWVLLCRLDGNSRPIGTLGREAIAGDARDRQSATSHTGTMIAKTTVGAEIPILRLLRPESLGELRSRQ